MITSASECGICGRGCVILSPVVSGSELVSGQIGPRSSSVQCHQNHQTQHLMAARIRGVGSGGDVKVMLPYCGSVPRHGDTHCCLLLLWNTERCGDEEKREDFSFA